MQVYHIYLMNISTPYMMSTKRCKECGEFRHYTDFPLFSTVGAGRKNTCKVCSKQQATVRRRLRRQNPPPSSPGNCPSCGRHTTKWVLDHCHDTDKFRGYICDSCNVAFGKFADDPIIMHRSLTWLQTHGTKQNWFKGSRDRGLR